MGNVDKAEAEARPVACLGPSEKVQKKVGCGGFWVVLVCARVSPFPIRRRLNHAQTLIP